MCVCVRDCVAAVVRKQADLAGLPPSKHVFVLPKNHSARTLDTVEAPIGMPDAELEFQRAVCYAMGVPCSLVMQAYQVGRTGASSGSANESTVQSMQMFRSTCTRVAKALEDLLCCVYKRCYSAAVPVVVLSVFCVFFCCVSGQRRD